MSDQLAAQDLRALREELHLSRSQVAQAAGLTTRAIELIEARGYEPTPTTRRRLEGALLRLAVDQVEALGDVLGVTDEVAA